MNTKTFKTGLMLAAAALVLPMSFPAGAIAQPTTATVIIQEDSFTPQVYTFNPPLLTISPGTVVTWVNAGSLYHTVTMKASTTGDSFNVGLEPGESFTRAFTAAGAILYHCVPHELPQNGNMRGGIIVA